MTEKQLEVAMDAIASLRAQRNQYLFECSLLAKGFVELGVNLRNELSASEADDLFKATLIVAERHYKSGVIEPNGHTVQDPWRMTPNLARALTRLLFAHEVGADLPEHVAEVVKLMQEQQ